MKLAKAGFDGYQSCQYWLEKMQRVKDPRYASCFAQVAKASTAPTEAGRNFSYKRLLSQWMSFNICSEVDAYERHMDMFSMLAPNNDSTVSAATTKILQSTWIEKLQLTAEQAVVYERIVNASHCKFKTDAVSVLGTRPLSDQQERNRIKFIQIVLDHNLYRTWAKHFYATDSNVSGVMVVDEQDSSVSLEILSSLKPQWEDPSLVLQKLPAYMWYLPNDLVTSVYHFIVDSEITFFPLAGDNLDGYIYSQVLMLLIVLALHKKPHRHPLWQHLVRQALEKEEVDWLAVYIFLCGIQFDETSKLNVSAMQDAAAFVVVRCIERGSSPSRIVQRLTDFKNGWPSPENIRLAMCKPFRPKQVGTIDKASIEKVDSISTSNPSNNMQDTGLVTAACIWCQFVAQYPNFPWDGFHFGMTSGVGTAMARHIRVYAGLNHVHHPYTDSANAIPIVAKTSPEYYQQHKHTLSTLPILHPEWFWYGDKQDVVLFAPLHQFKISGQCSNGVTTSRKCGEPTTTTRPVYKKRRAPEPAEMLQKCPPTKKPVRLPVTIPSEPVETGRPKRSAQVLAKQTFARVIVPRRKNKRL